MFPNPPPVNPLRLDNPVKGIGPSFPVVCNDRNRETGGNNKKQGLDLGRTKQLNLDIYGKYFLALPTLDSYSLAI